jgi:3-phenylpropionate/cinnamic acid dioxygenase small subunit
MVDELDVLERACTRFYYREAELLDRAEFPAWLATLHPQIDYRVPVRTTRDNRDGDGFSDRAFFMQEDHGSLSLRVQRLGSPYNWAENPRTRTRRMVGNVRVGARQGEDLRVDSNLVVFCHRADAAAPLMLTCERQDVLRWCEGRWTLARRMALLDTTVLGHESLSVFL